MKIRLKYDDDDDDEKIVINMDELSLASLVSLEHNESASEDSIQVFQQHEHQQAKSATAANNNDEATHLQQQHHQNQHLHQHHDYHQQVDDQFENDLKMLDQKIFKVKKMLDSMKSS